MRIPLVIIYAIIAFNITMFTLLLQADKLIFNALVYKIIAWVATAVAWGLTWRNRHKSIKLL